MQGIESLIHFFSSIGLPKKYKELGVQSIDINRLIEKLNINTGGKIGQFYPLDMNDARSIYEIGL